MIIVILASKLLGSGIRSECESIADDNNWTASAKTTWVDLCVSNYEDFAIRP